MAYSPNNPNGQAAMASSAPVVIASNQSSIPVAATLTAETTKVIGTVNVAAAQTLATVTTVGAVTEITNALPAGTNNIGDVDVLSIAAGDNNIGNVDIVTMPNVVIGSGTVTTVSTVTNVSQQSGVAISIGTGVRDAGTQRVTIATNDSVPVTFTGSTDVATQTTLASVLTSVQLIDDTVTTDNGAFTDGTTKLSMGGFIYDEVAGTALTENDSAAARINVNRAQVGIIEDSVTRGRYATVSASNALKVDGSAVTQPVSIATNTPTLLPATTGGLTTYHLVSAATTNATNIKNSAGQVFGWYIYNSNAAARKVAFHNTAGTPTAGASIFFTLVIPPTSGANVMSDIGITFSTGIAITTVTDLTDAGATAVALNDLNINIFYK